MAGPWEKYQQPDGPWNKYRANTASDPLTLPTQAMSGVNEGVANFLSLPNSIELGLRSIGPAIGNALGGDFQMPTDSLLPDAGENYRNAATDIGAIKPETGDAGSQFVRRVGQEVGANLFPVAATPARVAGAVSSLGSGIGAATMQMVAPDNPLAEFAGQMAGGLTPVGIGNAIERQAIKTAAPSLDDLKATKTGDYKAADNLGVRYAPAAINRLVGDIEAAAAKASPMRHKNTVSMLEEIRGLRGKPLTLTEVDELRQTIARDLIKSSDGGERYFGFQMNNALDDFIAKAGAGDVLSGDPIAAATAINRARASNTKYKKTEDFTRQMGKAHTQASSTGSGGNINNAIRQKARQILDNPKRTQSYTPEELALLEKLVGPDIGEDILRGVGKVAPGGNGLMTALNIGAVAHNPGLVAVPVVGQLAKFAADRGTINRARELGAMLARGGKADAPALAPRSQQALAALLAGQAANQNTPRQIDLANALLATQSNVR